MRLFDKPIKIQVQNPDTEQWEDALDLHAKVNKTGGGQSFSAGADQYHVTKTFEVRYIKLLDYIAHGVQPFRIVYRGANYKVVDYDDFMEKHNIVKMVGVLYV